MHNLFISTYNYIRGYSSVGRAPALQAGGREFESLYLHSVKFILYQHRTLKTAYTKHLEYVKRKDRDENEALYLYSEEK